jgi:hypothetical protein
MKMKSQTWAIEPTGSNRNLVDYKGTSMFRLFPTRFLSFLLRGLELVVRMVWDWSVPWVLVDRF